MDEASFENYVQRHVLSESQLEAQASRRLPPPDA
jgi:hypothetical protein